MDKIHGRLSVHVFTHGYGSMDDMVQIGIAVVDIDTARYKTGFNKVPFLFGQFRFSGILLQYDQVAAHFRTRIGKQIVRQTMVETRLAWFTSHSLTGRFCGESMTPEVVI